MIKWLAGNWPLLMEGSRELKSATNKMPIIFDWTRSWAIHSFINDILI